MKPTALLTIIILAGCATPAQRAQQACTELGLAKDPVCLVNAYQVEQQKRTLGAGLLMNHGLNTLNPPMMRVWVH